MITAILGSYGRRLRPCGDHDLAVTERVDHELRFMIDGTWADQ
jgi:hypothetical protein